MRLGVISDTHDNVAAIERAVDAFEGAGIETVLHCGDFIAPPTIPFFEGFALHGVLGNNDGELDGLEAFIRDLGNGSRLHGRVAELTLDGREICLLHGDQGRDAVAERARSGAYDYVLYGHFHETEERREGDTIVVNPGAHFPTVPDEHRRVAVIDTEADEVEFIDVSG